MPVHLEITKGPAQGVIIPLSVGKTVSVGRSAAKAMIALPEDGHLSGLHFTVGLRNGNVLLCNLSQTNPTEMDGQAVQSSALKPGQSFKAGENVFSVVGVANPHPAAYRVGGWGFEIIPEGWEIDEGKGLRHTHSEPFRANLLVAEEALPTDHDLAKYVDLQVSLGTKNLPAAVFGKPTPVQVKGAEAAVALTIHANAPKGPALQYQIYAVHSGIVGIVTATALESQPELLRSLLTQLLPGLTFFQG